MNISLFLKRYKYFIFIIALISTVGFLFSELIESFVDPFNSCEKKYINKAKKVVIGFQNNIFPYYSKYEPNKNIGFNVYRELIKNLFNIEIEAKYYKTPQDIFNSVKNNRINVGVISKIEKEKYEDFCKEFINSGKIIIKGYIIIKDENSNFLKKDVRDLKVAVVKGSMWERQIKDKFPDMKYYTVENTKLLVQGLKDEQYEAIIEEISIFERVAEDLFDSLEFSKKNIFQYNIFLFTNNKNILLSGITKKVVRSLDILSNNDINIDIDSLLLINIYKNRSYYFLALSIILILVIILLWNKILRKKVAESTKKLKLELEKNIKIQNKLEERERHYIMAQKVGNIGSWERDLETGELYWSEHIEPMFGYEEGTFDGKYNKFISRVHPDYVDLNINASNECIKTGKKYVITFKIVLPSGEERWIKEYGDLIRDKEGKAIKLIGVSRDITKQKKYEHDLEIAKKEAEISEKLKTEFLANISHEIRTPVTAIMGFTELLKNFDNSEEQSSYLDYILTSSNYLMINVNNIINAAKIETGELEVLKDSVDCNDIMEHIKRIVLIQNISKDVELTIDIPKKGKYYLETDFSKIVEILFLLISNSIKFTKNGFIKCFFISDEHYNIFKIIDSGKGIDKAVLNEIFKAFTQEDSSSTREYGGLGLGLYICKNLVEALDGKIEIKSEKDSGTEIDIIFKKNQ